MRHAASFLYAACATLCFATLVVAGPVPVFRTEMTFATDGFRMKLFGAAKAVPLPSPAGQRYTMTQGDISRVVTLFSVRDLWLPRQLIGVWRDAHGNTLTLGRMAAPLPESPQSQGVLREAFDALYAASVKDFDATDGETMRAWVAAFLNVTVTDAPELLRAPLSLASVWRISVADPATCAYVFTLKNESTRFCVALTLADKTSLVSTKIMETQVLPSIRALTRRTTSSSRQLVSTSGEKQVIVPDPRREAAKQSIVNNPDWWFAETPEYIFLSNLRSSTGRTLMQEVEKTMGMMRRAYALYVPPVVSKVDSGIVRIFETAEDYRAYVGAKYAWSSGLWDPSRGELLVLGGEAKGVDARNTMLSTLRHEAFHQYLFYATGNGNHAMWFNEGHACFFESVRVNTAKQRVMMIEGNRAQQVTESLDEIAALLPTILTMDNTAFYGGASAEVSQKYAAAWALIYFLQKGVPSSPSLAAYANVLPTYLAAMTTDGDWRHATQTAWGSALPRTLAEDFKTFWLRGRNRAKYYEKASPGERKTL